MRERERKRESIPVNLSDPHGRRSPAIQNEKAGD